MSARLRVLLAASVAIAIAAAAIVVSPASAVQSPGTTIVPTTPLSPVAPGASSNRQDRQRQAPDRESGSSRQTPSGGDAQATTPDPFGGMDLGPLSGAGAAASTQIPGTLGGRGDFLAKNGLKVPGCRGDDAPSCVDSGTRSIPVPPGHYSLDTWMESGTLGLPKWSNLLAELTAFVWSVIVQITATLFAALEWALNLDLLLAGDGALARLQLLKGEWGMPVAAVLLVLGAMWVAIQSAFAGKMGSALKNAWLGFLVAGVSMAILANPSGTIGELAEQSGDLGREAAGMPLRIVNQDETLDGGLARMWEAAVERPWALLEFGDVTWATRASKLEPEIKDEAERIAAAEGEHKVRRAKDANTNGRFFLLWEANSQQRNDKDEECEGGKCLLNVLCGGDDMEQCTGPMAKYVEARTEKGVVDRALQIFVIGLGMVALWIVLAGIVFGLLWSAISAVTTLIELAFMWPLALTFKPEWRAKVTELLMRLVGSALAYVIFGIAAGITMTAFMLAQRVPGGWLTQWVLTIAAMVLLWLRRKQIKEYMDTLTSGQKTAGAAGGFASRLASSYATGLGLGALRGGPLGGRKPVGAAKGAGAGGGGGLPSSLPGDDGKSGPGRGKLALGALAGGVVAGPVGSAAAVGALKREAIAERGVAAYNKVAEPVKQGMEKTAAAGRKGSGGGGPTVGPGGLVAPSKQAGALLAGQRASRIAAAGQARDRLPAAREALRAAEQNAQAAKLMRDAHQEGGPGWDGASERYAMAEHARQEAARVVDQLEHVERAGADTESWTTDGGEFTADHTQRAGAWLDQQSELPQASRSYGQLAAMHGVSSQAFHAMDASGQERIRTAIDASLTARAAEAAAPATRSPLATLSKVASAQKWRVAR